MQALKNTFYIFIDNIEYFGILVLLFLAVFALIYAVGSLLSNRRSQEEKRLDKLVRAPGAPKTSEDRPRFLSGKQDSLATKISKPLHKLSALNERSTRNKLRLKLVRAGYRSDMALYNYLAMKIILAVLLVGIYMISRIFYSFVPEMMLAVLFLALLGYFTPNIWVWLMTLARKERLFKALPDALDLMVVCVEAGLGLDMTFKRVGDEIRPLSKDLSDEFLLTNLEVRAGRSREDAFKNMSIRTGVPEIHNLMTVLAQTSRFGTSLATALRVHADAMRVKRRQIAEETAAKATVKLIFPLVLFIFPAIFVVLIGPGAIKIVQQLFPVLGG
jgi:tight adherence protein C